MSYLNDLRPASFTAPSGSVHDFKFDELKRDGGKKIATIEILDSDESFFQDMGGTATVFPMDIYFTGEEYHKAADAFWMALSEHYTADAPGRLKHPRWGDIDVVPTRWSQSEAFVDGAQVGVFTVEFRKSFPTTYPKSDAQTEGDAASGIDDLQDSSTSALGNAITETQSAISNIKGKVQSAVNTVSKALKKVASIQKEIIDKYEDAQDTINGMIDDIGSSLVEIVAGAQYIMRLPSSIATSTMDKLNGYYDMIGDLVDGFNDEAEGTVENRINNAILLEVFAGFAVAAMAEAAIYTEYETRGDGSDAIELLLAGYEAYRDGIEAVKVEGNAAGTYTGDHNFESVLAGVMTKVCSILLNRSFDLKAERRRVLTAASDPITLCYEFYGAVDNETLEYFLRTNEITGDEFIEIPAGREVVSYA